MLLLVRRLYYDPLTIIVYNSSVDYSGEVKKSYITRCIYVAYDIALLVKNYIDRLNDIAQMTRGFQGSPN